MSTHRSPCLDLGGLLRVAGGGVLISFSGLFVKLAHVGPSQSAFYRMFFGGVALLCVALARRERLRARRGVWAVMVAAAVFFALDLECWHRSILLIGPGLATIIGNFQVFFIAIAGAVLLRERLSVRHMAAIPLALAGLWWLLGVSPAELLPVTADGGLAVGDALAGVAYGLATALFYTGFILLLRHSQGMGGMLTPVANMALVSLVCAAMIGAGILARGGAFAIGDAPSFGYLVTYGILCQAAGWVLLSTGLPRLPASLAGLVMVVQPALAFVWDILLFDRPTDGWGMAGAGLSLFAIWLGLSGASGAPGSSGGSGARVCRPGEAVDGPDASGDPDALPTGGGVAGAESRSGADRDSGAA